MESPRRTGGRLSVTLGRRSDTKEPVAYAAVVFNQLTNAPLTATVEEDGAFVLSNVPFGPYRVTAKQAGFYPDSTSFVPSEPIGKFYLVNSTSQLVNAFDAVASSLLRLAQ